MSGLQSFARFLWLVGVLANILERVESVSKTLPAYDRVNFSVSIRVPAEAAHFSHFAYHPHKSFQAVEEAVEPGKNFYLYFC